MCRRAQFSARETCTNEALLLHRYARYGLRTESVFRLLHAGMLQAENPPESKKGDWVVGLTPKAAGNDIVYFMQVDDVVESFDDYWSDRRFGAKKPTYAGGLREKCGDNIYEPQASGGGYRQLRSMHSNGDSEDEENKARDLRGKRILVSETFAYLGSKALPLPTRFQSLIVGIGYRSRFSDDLIAEFIRFAGGVGFGVHGAPRQWPDGDDSWMEGCGCTTRKKQ